jgi:hypothetical protein
MNIPNITESRLFKWRFNISYILIVLLSVFTLGFRLNNLYGTDVSNAYENIKPVAYSDIISDAVALPFKLVHTTFHTLLGDDNVSSLRISSSFFGLITLLAIYGTTRRLHSERAGIMSALGLLCSAWFLPITRSGGAFITLPAGLAIVWAAFSYIYLKRRSHGGMIIAAGSLAIASYLPLGIVWIFIGLSMAPKSLHQELLKPFKRLYISGSMSFYALLLLPLIYTLFKHPAETFKQLFLLPDTLPSLKVFGERLLGAPLSFVWRSPVAWELHLGRQTLLDIVSLTLVTLGSLYVLRNWRLKRIRFMVASSLLAVAVYALNGEYAYLSLLIPPMYVALGMGASRLYRGWTDMFPRNSIARSLAIIPLTLVILLSFYYNLQYVFHVMPRTPEVVKTYVKIETTNK